MLFKKAFQGMPNVTTFETEFVDGEHYHDFDGTVYINHREFLTVGDFGGSYMVYINNPHYGAMMKNNTTYPSINGFLAITRASTER